MGQLKLGNGADFTGGTGGALSDAPSGTIIQVQHVYHTQTAQVTKTGTASEIDTDLRLAFTPRMSNSKLYFTFSAWFCSPNSTNLYYSYIYDVTNTEMPGQPPANGSRQRVHWSNRVSPDDANDFHSCNYEFAVTNTSTSARTYTPYFGSEGASAEFYASTLSSTSGVVAPIFFKIMEVAP